jgi:hypothetical protein
MLDASAADSESIPRKKIMRRPFSYRGGVNGGTGDTLSERGDTLKPGLESDTLGIEAESAASTSVGASPDEKSAGASASNGDSANESAEASASEVASIGAGEASETAASSAPCDAESSGTAGSVAATSSAGAGSLTGKKASTRDGSNSEVMPRSPCSLF